MDMAASAMRVAVVTGANKGIGYQVAHQLIGSSKFDRVVIGCRNKELGAQAARDLGPACEFVPLDLDDASTIDSFAGALGSKYGKLDCLVNNAAIAFKAADPTPFEGQTGPTLRVNFYRTVALTEALLPLLERSESPRLVNVASMSGRLSQLSAPLQQRLSDPALTLGGLRSLVGAFESDVAAGCHAARGWGQSNYGFSKLALIAATKVLARDYPRFRVNCCCPGYCDTDMSSHRGPRPASEGARNAVLCAFQPDDGFTGGFVQDCRLSEW